MLPYGNIFYRSILSGIFCIRTWAGLFKNGPIKICGKSDMVYLSVIRTIAPEENCYAVRLKVWVGVRVEVGNCPRTCLSRPYHFKFFKGCLPQILLGPFLNTLTHVFPCSGIS